MTTWETKLALLEATIRRRVPGFSVRFKDQSAGQKFLGAVLFFNKGFMTEYITTIGKTVYFPTEKGYRENPERSFNTLAHEYVHLVDGKDHPFWFGFSYLLPQLLAILALGAIAAVWSLWFLFFLVWAAFLAPVPAYWRMKWELRGYTMTLAMEAWKTGKVSDGTMSRILSNFTGPDYYFMWPGSGMKTRLDEAVKGIHNGDVLIDPPFSHVRDIVSMSDAEAEKALKRLA